jgi:nitrite reductase/ring-hydroxylating ferredoxin subunit
MPEDSGRSPRSRTLEAQALDARIDSPGREGLTGTARAGVYERAFEAEDISIAPDGAPPEAQPRWRQDFPIDWPADQYVARRDFARFLVLTSGAFAAGQAWVAAQHLVRKNRPIPPRLRVANLGAVAVGSAVLFSYPGPHDPCLLIRPDATTVVAYSQLCTHLSCAVVPRVEEGVLHCPCHEGYFDLHTGRNVAGPPPRPLPKILLEVVGEDVFAIGVEERTA